MQDRRSDVREDTVLYLSGLVLGNVNERNRIQGVCRVRRAILVQGVVGVTVVSDDDNLVVVCLSGLYRIFQAVVDCLNRFLPPDIRLLEGWEGRDGFDSNRSAKRKTYCYSLYESRREMPLLERYAVRVDELPKIEDLRRVAKLFEGEHDFKAFCASGSSVKTTVRTVYEVKVEEMETFALRVVKIYVTGNGFLYNMVRTMAGELLDLASSKKAEESLQKAFQTGDRNLLGKTMPAKGLLLQSVEYNQ